MSKTINDNFSDDDKIILQECPKCEWMPDGLAHWKCSCGHKWDTFSTKGVCPKCNASWEDTSCPACNTKSKHKLWYIKKSEKQLKIARQNPILRQRKIDLEQQLKNYGIQYFRISHLGYLDFNSETLRPLHDVGCRILVLKAVLYAVENIEDVNYAKTWLEENNLWIHVSENEKLLFTKKQTKTVLNKLSWRIEAFIVLCWAVNLIENLPNLDDNIEDIEIDKLFERITIEKDLDTFVSKLSYRTKEDILMENLTNELITAHLRDNLFVDDNYSFNVGASFERHQALNWIRMFSGEKEWDNVDTST